MNQAISTSEKYMDQSPEMRMVIVATPRRAQNTKMDLPAGVLGVISPEKMMLVLNQVLAEPGGAITVTNSGESNIT